MVGLWSWLLCVVGLWQRDGIDLLGEWEKDNGVVAREMGGGGLFLHIDRGLEMRSAYQGTGLGRGEEGNAAKEKATEYREYICD